MLVLLKGHEPWKIYVNIILLVQVSYWVLIRNHFSCPTQGREGIITYKRTSFLQHESIEIICILLL